MPVTGDLTLENLGLSVEDRAKITENVHVILNCAASVKFDDKLHKALQINYWGAQRILQLAKECKHLEVLSHVSTAYANCDRSGFIEEKIYDPLLDVASIVNDIEAQTPEYLEENL